MKINLKEDPSQYYDNYFHSHKQKLKKGYSYSNPDGDREAVYTHARIRGRRTSKNSSKTSHSRSPELTIYKISEKKASAPAPASKPAPKPKAKAKPKEPIQHSPEIQQAKDRVNAYENGKSPWEEAQANVKSSYIKNAGSTSNEQYDFSSNTFDAKESSEPNEQAQAAQNQLQNYLSKYSGYKSNT